MSKQLPSILVICTNIIEYHFPVINCTRGCSAWQQPKAQQAPAFGAGTAQLPRAFQIVFSILGFPKAQPTPRAAQTARQELPVIQVVWELISSQTQSSLGWEASPEVADPTPAPSRAHHKGGSGCSGPRVEYLNISRMPQSLFLAFDHIQCEDVFPYMYLQFLLLLLQPPQYVLLLKDEMLYKDIFFYYRTSHIFQKGGKADQCQRAHRICLWLPSSAVHGRAASSEASHTAASVAWESRTPPRAHLSVESQPALQALVFADGITQHYLTLYLFLLVDDCH